MADPVQPSWPLQFVTLPNGAVQLADTPQGSDQDRRSSAAIVVCTPRGWRDDLPDFGVSSLLFQQGQIDTERLAAEIAQSDQALADITADEALAHLADTRQVTVDAGHSA
jgi:hypothetical protein